jgi:hypothetical protein
VADPMVHYGCVATIGGSKSALIYVIPGEHVTVLLLFWLILACFMSNLEDNLSTTLRQLPQWLEESK